MSVAMRSWPATAAIFRRCSACSFGVLAYSARKMPIRSRTASKGNAVLALICSDDRDVVGQTTADPLARITRSDRFGVMRQTAFRLTETDLAIMDEVARRTGLHTRVDGLRYLLRFWAERSKVDVDALMMAKTKTKRARKKY